LKGNEFQVLPIAIKKPSCDAFLIALGQIDNQQHFFAIRVAP
jgi:hypothetical protein